MKKNEWEVFWEWLGGEGSDYDSDYSYMGSWLDGKKYEWESFDECPKCRMPGLREREDMYDGYVVGKYDQCVNCMEQFNKVNLGGSAKQNIITEIERGNKSTNDIRYLIERFNLHAEDTSKAWVKEVIIEFRKEVEEAKEFAKVTQQERDNWAKELKKRMQRKIENDENKK